jgi:glycosyltransferase involved in cell wall biosynthesis
MPDDRRPTRILFLQTQAEMAGAQEISRLLGQELSFSAGPSYDFEVHHVFLYKKTDGCDQFPNVNFAAQERPSGLFSGLRLLRNLALIIRRTRPDVILTFQHYGNIVGAPVARFLGVRKIIANHVSAPATINGAVRLIDRWLGLTGFYDVITVNSHATWNDYQAYPERYRRRLVHVPHGFSKREVTLPKETARQTLGLPPVVPIMGTVARLHPLKQIDLAIRILPLLPNLHFAVAGQGPDEARLKNLVVELDLEDRVHFIGEIPPDAIGNFLICLDVFAFPSAAETFGLAAVEAAQAGIPVVANSLPVLHEVLQVDGVPCALFVDASDAQAFGLAVEKLLTDQDLARRLGVLGERLSERYSLGAMVEDYRRLINGERSGRSTALMTATASGEVT